MANKAAIVRLQKEYRAILKEPVPQLSAHPSPSNLLEWHFAVEGGSDSPYEGGVYHGKITFPAQYPYKPPSIVMLTPSGRFATSTKLCLSMTDFHPESWNPMWSVSTILTGLLSFMHDSAFTTGAVVSSDAEKRQCARDSLTYNVRNPTFRKLFPEWVAKHEERQAAVAAAAAAEAAAADATAAARPAEAQWPAAAAGRPAGDAESWWRAVHLPDGAGSYVWGAVAAAAAGMAVLTLASSELGRPPAGGSG